MSVPYHVLASYYETMMKHFDYSMWASFLKKIIKKEGLEPESILELGAGTGSLAENLRFSSVKSRVTTDISIAMISLASPKWSGHRLVADASAIPLRGPFDLILMTYDAINYLSPLKLQLFFEEVYRLLNQGGLFVFDATTEYNSYTHFEDLHDLVQIKDDFIARHSWYDFIAKKQYNEFNYFIQTEDKLYKRYTELHEQVVYPISFFENLARSNSLKIKATYSDFSEKKGNRKAERIHFVLSKE